MTIYPKPWSNLGQFAGTIGAACGFVLLARFGWSKGIAGHIAAHIFGVFALVSLLCAVQSLVWAMRKIATLDLRSDSVILHLTGGHAIEIPDHEIAQVVLAGVAHRPMIVAFEVTSPNVFRGRLPFLDRCYFDYSKKFVGSGLSYHVSLSPEDLAQFINMLRTRFGERVELV